MGIVEGTCSASAQVAPSGASKLALPTVLPAEIVNVAGVAAGVQLVVKLKSRLGNCNVAAGTGPLISFFTSTVPTLHLRVLVTVTLLFSESSGFASGVTVVVVPTYASPPQAAAEAAGIGLAVSAMVQVEPMGTSCVTFGKLCPLPVVVKLKLDCSVGSG